ncbi:relaxase/mobilization nuclease domain-containing protein [Xenorhabdus yunnanensis]|uniref:relaxase/mobilization nuclease domain-containing protein n=1 Tax=Xenorhabdus yunnanensis TaxID=3025878 RepID=UPI004038F4F8
MIVGFSRYGTGGGCGPVDYVTDEQRSGREHAPPVVLRGSPEATRDLIDSLDFKHKYTSGVLSFAPGEEITPEMEQDCMNRFEALAFAGLDPDQYNVLWVRHSHADHHELHFVTPRVELSTGKSLNIRPPGAAAKQAFDDFRSEVNARYGLADPDDPHRAREIVQPDHLLKIAAEAIRRGEKPQGDMRVLIDAVLSQRAVQGVIRNRRDVIEQVADLGLEVTREGKNYITVSDPESGQRWRMKGGLYEREFDATRAIEAAVPRGERDYTGPDPAGAGRYSERVDQHIVARTRYHAERYPSGTGRGFEGTECVVERLPRDPEQFTVECVEKPDITAVPEHGGGLSCYLAERLGNEYLSGKPDFGELEDDQRPERDAGSLREAHGGSGYNPRQQRRVCCVAEGSEGREPLDSEQSESTEDREVEHDRAGNAFIERLKTYGATIQRTTRSIRASASRFAADVRTYCGRQRHAVGTSQLLEQSSDRIDHAAPAVRECLQAEQVIRRQQVERAQLKNKPNRSYGPSL